MSEGVEIMTVDTLPSERVELDKPSAPVAVSTPTSMAELLFVAVQNKSPVEELKELVALHERISERQAQKDLAEALAKFQAETPSIKHNKSAAFATRSGGKMSYTYASLDEIATKVVPMLAKHGLSFTHDAKVVNGMIDCTCTIRHFAGATHSATIQLPTSSNSAASDQQKINAALTFARRLTLSMALGLTTTDEDRDGRDDEVTLINEEQADTLVALAQELGGDEKRLLKFLNVEALRDLPAIKYKDAVMALEQKIRERNDKAAQARGN